MKGTTKQIAWANDIMSEKLKALDCMELDSIQQREREELAKVEDASWWIERRTYRPKSLLNEMFDSIAITREEKVKKYRDDLDINKKFVKFSGIAGVIARSNVKKARKNLEEMGEFVEE